MQGEIEMNRNEERELLVQTISDNIRAFNLQVTEILMEESVKARFEGLLRTAAEQIVSALRKDLCDG